MAVTGFISIAELPYTSLTANWICEIFGQGNVVPVVPLESFCKTVTSLAWGRTPIAEIEVKEVLPKFNHEN